MGEWAVSGLLPLKGKEFGILAVILLSISVTIISKQIVRANLCEIKN
jgi:hypothetical protein